MEKMNYEKFLIYLRQLQNKIQKDFNEELKKFHLTSTYIGILILLFHHKEGYSMSELSRLTSVDNALMTRNIKELEKVNYIYRNRENDFQRKYHICLTEEGRNVAKDLEQLLEKRQKDFLKLFTSEEQEILDKAFHIVISKFTNNLEKGEEEKC